MLKRVFALIVLMASVGLAACSPAASTEPTLGGGPPAGGTPAAGTPAAGSEAPVVSPTEAPSTSPATSP